MSQRAYPYPRRPLPASVFPAEWLRMQRAEQRRLRGDRLRRRAMLVLAALAGVLVGATWARANAPRTGVSAENPIQTVVIHPGDTLTSLARRYPANGETVAERRQSLADLNGGDPGSLVPGQLIRIR